MAKMCALFVLISQFCSSGFPKAKSCTRDMASITPTGSFHKVGPVAHRTSQKMHWEQHQLAAGSFPEVV